MGLNIISTFLHSAIQQDNLSCDSLGAEEWLAAQRKNKEYSVSVVPIAKLDDWSINSETGDLAHHTGRFFSIQGIEFETDQGKVSRWQQPIINQPEIGILGILVKKIQGVYHLLMQAKFEPGNVNDIQIAPTVQATFSNYSQVHGGKRPEYLEYFIGRLNGRILYDQLQSEQGARFYKKRNRNIVVELSSDVPLLPGFRWFTFGEVKRLLRQDCSVNMVARTVLSCIPLLSEEIRYQYEKLNLASLDISKSLGFQLCAFSSELIRSLLATDRNAHYTNTEILSWLTDLKCKILAKSRYIPLNQVSSWEYDGTSIFHQSGRFFKVIGVDVTSNSREVNNWNQPLLEQENAGLTGFLVKKIRGIYHFLVQAKVEPGSFDLLEIGPTVSCSEVDYKLQLGIAPPFVKYFVSPTNSIVHYSSMQSEEGGRFFKYKNKFMIVEVAEEIDVPANYTWITLGQISQLMNYNNLFNIEARGLLACLDFVDTGFRN